MNKNKNNKIFHIQRIYIKDISFESPNTPKIFKDHWNPKININIRNNSSKIDHTLYEVILCITVTATIQDRIAFLCQVQQAGIFNISGIDQKKITYCLNAYCPNILFPYARECINNQICRGSFPQLYLNPINFDALFTESIKNNS